MTDKTKCADLEDAIIAERVIYIKRKMKLSFFWMCMPNRTFVSSKIKPLYADSHMQLVTTFIPVSKI